MKGQTKDISTSPLNQKQLRFCEEYVIDNNGKHAAIRAGYAANSAEVSASKLLRIAKVQEKIQELRAKISEKCEIDATWVLNRFKEISDRCMQAVPVMRFDPVEKGMVQKKDEDGEGVWEFDSAGANRATELIGKHIGFFENDNRQRQANIQIGYGKEE